eukprot:TRINITY_DN16926_c0_g1_i1.p1 TRINITY_DN16926_c0_g1~~TRINITY_DN16926_c0_g1_i1.p1  ORF type:complete len:648 (+),score=214.20 TRINITY_DN16926_c0_g1_i1:271-1944(+)
MCLLLDPAEATRNTHPSAAYRESASEAFNYVYRYMSELNTSRELYSILEVLVTDEYWDKLTPVQKVNTRLMKTDMDANGIHLPREQRDIVVKLTSEKEELGHYLVTANSLEEQQRILNKLLDTRHKLAQLLEFPSYADWAMQSTMAGKPEHAWTFLNTVSTMLQPKARQETQILDFLSKQFTSANLSHAELGHIYKSRKYGEQIKEMTKYLSVANVWRGLQLICKELFGVTIKREENLPDYEQYHPTVQKYVLHDDNGVIGTIYADLIDRPDKMKSAGHFTVQLGTQLHKEVLTELNMKSSGYQLPIVIFTCNAQVENLSDDWEKVFLSPHEMVTVFHEFGHALHTMFGQTEYQNVAGTRSSLDYVEAFSQFFEYFAHDYRVLSQFARHHQTDKVIPEELVDAFNQSELCFSATEKLNQLIFSGVDLACHGPRPMSYTAYDGSHVPCDDTSRLVAELSNLHLPVSTENNLSLAARFSMQHMSNYPAGYYSYTYSKVIAAAMWEKYFKNNPLSREGGMKLRHIMSLGASQHQTDMLSCMFPEKADPAKMVQAIDINHL